MIHEKIKLSCLSQVMMEVRLCHLQLDPSAASCFTTTSMFIRNLIPNREVCTQCSTNLDQRQKIEMASRALVHESWFCSWFCSWICSWFGSGFDLWYMVHGVLNNVLLDNGGLPFIFPFKVHLDFGHHCNTQWYLRLLSEPCNPTQTI